MTIRTLLVLAASSFLGARAIAILALMALAPRPAPAPEPTPWPRLAPAAEATALKGDTFETALAEVRGDL